MITKSSQETAERMEHPLFGFSVGELTDIAMTGVREAVNTTEASLAQAGQIVLDALNGAQEQTADMLNIGIDGLTYAISGQWDTTPYYQVRDWSNGALVDEPAALHQLYKFAGGQLLLFAASDGISLFTEGTEVEEAVNVVREVCGTEGECFTGNTQVITGIDPVSGQYITADIDTLHVGDIVLTKSELDPDAPLQERQITNVSVHHVESVVDLQIQSADGSTQTIQTTDVHPFYVSGIGWVDAGNLQPGATLLLPDDTTATLVSSAHEEHPEGIAVYNLTVDGGHTFFVAGSGAEIDPTWVHNDCVDARALRQNLIDAGEEEAKYAAHIVPTGEFSGRSTEVQTYIQYARDLLDDAGIDLNDAENGFFSDSANHLGTHTDKYFENSLNSWAMPTTAGVLQA